MASSRPINLLNRHFLCLAAFTFLPLVLEATEEETEESSSEKSFTEFLEECETKPGLFPLHQDKEKGTLFLEISKKQMSEGDTGPEFIHFSHTLDGVPSLGFFRGQFAPAKIFRIRRHFDRIEFVAENNSFYFRPDSALSRASSANISSAILASPEIVSISEKEDRFLVKADEVFLKEFFRQLKPGKDKDDKEERFSLGSLSKERTRFIDSRSFPDNTLFRVQYVFENMHPSERGDDDVADSRFVTLKIQHSLLPVPESDYQPRFEDPRVGFFTTQVTDLTSKSSAPYRDFIHRWDLRKKDPGKEISDPIEPVTWWIENTTPIEIRETIKDAVLAWNLAFESAGISNALTVKVQPDDADWDADDIRYHVLRWTSSPDPPFGGYGPSFVNPRTGQILGSDIMLEYVFLTNRVRFRELVNLGEASERNSFPFMSRSPHFCQAGNCIHATRIGGTAILKAQAARFGNGPIDTDELITQALTDLILHEVGHTLGLNHNFRASHLYDRKKIHDSDLTAKTGLTGSVMDYSPINLATDPKDQGHYFSIVPGPYDHWAIRFGYGAEEDVESVLAESTRPEHAFANDADDMRRAGRGIDPRAMINDLTNEPIAHAADQMKMVRATLPVLLDQFPVEGESYHELRTAFSSLMRVYGRATEVVSRFPGGVLVDRSFHGQEGAAPVPFTPVTADKQREAMKALDSNLFSAGALSLPPDLVATLQMQRRGFNFFDLESNEDPKVHERVLGMQKRVLDQLLHPKTLARVVDSELYGNTYSLANFMSDLDNMIMEGDPEGQADTFREALQVDYIQRLIKMSGLAGDSKHPAQARSEAVYRLTQHDGNLIGKLFPDRHSTHLQQLISNALDKP